MITREIVDNFYELFGGWGVSLATNRLILVLINQSINQYPFINQKMSKRTLITIWSQEF